MFMANDREGLREKSSITTMTNTYLPSLNSAWIILLMFMACLLYTSDAADES